jgi:hypothetical protein
MDMYEYSVKLRDKQVNFRKWKVKDKNKFKAAMKENSNPRIVEQALVFDCLEDPSITLTPEEYKYLMVQIRKESVGDALHYEFICQDCGTEYEFDISIADTFIPTAKPYGKLKVKDTEFVMGEIQNLNIYKEEVSKFTDNYERSLFDFLMHVNKLNGSDTFTFDELFNFVNDMDLDIAEEIFKQWDEMKFNLKESKHVQCPNCKSTINVDFDILPGFLPANWN